MSTCGQNTAACSLNILEGRTEIRIPAGHFPVPGEWYRFVFALKGATDFNDRWPGALWRFVDQSPFWRADESRILSVTDRGIIVVDALALDYNAPAADLESLMSGFVYLNLSAEVIAEIVRIELVDPAFLTTISRADTAFAAQNVTWTPIEEDEPIPGFWGIIGESIVEAFGVVSETVEDVGETVGTTAGNVLSGTLKPSVVLTVGIVAAIYIYSKKGG